MIGPPPKRNRLEGYRMSNNHSNDNQTLQGVTNIFTQRSLEIDITYVCDMACLQCNRALGILPTAEKMTVEQIEKVLNESLALEQPFKNIWILGGEPTLHPHLPEILKVLEHYHTQVENCEVTLWSHGSGKIVPEKLKNLPAWINLKVSPKKPKLGGEGFEAFLAAPLDYPDYHDGNYSNGCTQIAPTKQGVSVSPYGIYGCPVAATIDRVVGLDIGIKKLDQISNENFREQLNQLCRYCGHFLSNQNMELGLESVSSTWQTLRDSHKSGNKPKLTRY